MKNLGTKTIETERLILRKFTTDDAMDMYKNWASDDMVTKFLTWPTHKLFIQVFPSWNMIYSNSGKNRKIFFLTRQKYIYIGYNIKVRDKLISFK